MNTILTYISAFVNVAVFYVLFKLYKKIGELERVEVVARTNEIVEVVASFSEEEEEEEADSSEAEENDATMWVTIEDKKARYKGEWMNGMPNGEGIKHVYEGDYYIECNFVDGHAHGYGKQTFEQTCEKTVPYYEGEFKRNEYHGMGEYHYGDGDYYKGEWKNSKYHGQGAEYSKRRNKTWVGEFENDEKVGGNWVKGEI
jgi:hypothetical protein